MGEDVSLDENRAQSLACAQQMAAACQDYTVPQAMVATIATMLTLAESAELSKQGLEAGTTVRSVLKSAFDEALRQFDAAKGIQG